MEMVHFIPPAQRRIALLAAQTDTAPALVLGTAGTGKSAIARWIHQNGPRAAAPLVTFDPKQPLVHQLLEAQQGTCVIHEVGELPLSEQKQLLQYLVSKTIPHPAGGEMPMLLNVRIIATSSQILEGRAHAGLFNPELLKKLNVFRVEMPDLARRMNELHDIILAILGELTLELHKEHIQGLSESAWEILQDYHWPGNIRELRNVLKVAVINSQSDRIEASDLPDIGSDDFNFTATREEFDKVYITELLRSHNWKVDKTAQSSQIPLDTLAKKIKKYGIDLNQHSSSISE